MRSLACYLKEYKKESILAPFFKFLEVVFDLIVPLVIAQIIVAYLIELFGLFGAEKAPFAWHKLIGAAIAIAGIMVFER